jgi:hypothetical protein
MKHQAGKSKHLQLKGHASGKQNKSNTTTQRNATQHNTTQHNTTQHNTASKEANTFCANMSDRNNQPVHLWAAAARYSRRRNVRLDARENCFRACFLCGIFIGFAQELLTAQADSSVHFMQRGENCQCEFEGQKGPNQRQNNGMHDDPKPKRWTNGITKASKT